VIDRHAEARALERLVPEVADRAFALLRDRPALAAFVARVAVDGDDDLALALDDGDAPPFLVVTRSGRAVTCLARGMSPIGARIGFDLVREELTSRARAFALHRAVHTHESHDGERPLERLARHPGELVLDDFVVVERLLPLVEDSLVTALDATIARLYALAKTGRAGLDDDAARALARLVHFCGHAIVLGRGRPRLLSRAVLALRLDDAYLAPRALFALANHPAEALTLLRALVDEGAPLPDPIVRLLLVIAARHASLADDVRALCARAGVDARPPGVDDGTTALVFWLHLPLLLGRYCPPAVRDMAPDARRALVDDARRGVAGRAMPWRAVAERLGPWFARVADLLDVERWLSSASPDVLATPAHHQGERVRLILWREMLTRARAPLAALPVEVQLGLSAAPLAALTPRVAKDPRAARALTAEAARLLVDDLAARRRVESAATPRPRAPGRNDPCPCGSGKKFKHCHGRP